MGNYQEYLKMMPSPLREIDPDQPKRLHTFGNPFKQDKKVKKNSPLENMFYSYNYRCSVSVILSCVSCVRA